MGILRSCFCLACITSLILILFRTINFREEVLFKCKLKIISYCLSDSYPPAFYNFPNRNLTLASKMIGVSPENIYKTKILILGSKYPMGIGLSRIFKNKSISFARIKNEYHFGKINEIKCILTLFCFQLIIDCSKNNFFDEEIKDFMKNQECSVQNKIHFIKFQYNCEIFQIIPNVFNNIYEFEICLNSMIGYNIPDILDQAKDYYIFEEDDEKMPPQSIPNNFDNFIRMKKARNEFSKKNKIFIHINDINRTNKINENDEGNKYFIYANQASSMIFSILNEYFGMFDHTGFSGIKMNFENNNDFDQINEFIRVKYVSKFVRQYNKNDDSLLVPKEIIEFNKMLSEDKEYVSIVTTLTNSACNIYRASIAMNFTQRIFGDTIYFPVKIIFTTLFLNNSNNSLKILNHRFLEPISQSEFKNKFGKLNKHIKIIDVPQRFVEILLKDYRINYFPEFIFRNIGIRRAKGKYIFSISSDVILPIEFFRMCVFHSFSKNIYIRTKDRKISDPTEISLISETPFYHYYKIDNEVNLELANYDIREIVIFEKPLLYFHASGDFQGFHRKYWYELKGYYEGKEVYHVDSFLAYDIISLPIPIFLKMLRFSYHITHSTVSTQTQMLDLNVVVKKINISNGICSANVKSLKQSLWGKNFEDFIEY